MNAPVSPQEFYQRSMDARRRVINESVERLVPLPSITFSPASQTQVNFTPSNAGLLKGFYVTVRGTLVNTLAPVANRTSWGVYNALSNITFTDLQQNQRVNCAGWWLAHLATAKIGYGFGGAYAPNLPAGYGNNYTVQSMAATMAQNVDTPIVAVYWVPIAYSGDDLRGAIYMGTTQANTTLSLTLNATPGYTAGSGALAMAGGAGTAVAWKTGTNVTFEVTQVYLDQLPVDRQTNSVVLPLDDLSQFYSLITTSVNGLTVGQDFPFNYANLRTFLSTTIMYDNAVAFAAGSFNYFALQSANFTQLWRLNETLVAQKCREEIMQDMPLGSYYFSHRRKPINTQQYGNMSLIVNPAIVTGATSQMLIGVEAFGRQTLMGQAGTIQGG